MRGATTWDSLQRVLERMSTVLIPLITNISLLSRAPEAVMGHRVGFRRSESTSNMATLMDCCLTLTTV